MFQCDKCGLCCLGLDKHEETKDMHNGDGVCIHLDRKTMLCHIYENRPIFCRVDDYFEQGLAGEMSEEEFYRLNYEACEEKKRAWKKKQEKGDPWQQLDT